MEVSWKRPAASLTHFVYGGIPLRITSISLAICNVAFSHLRPDSPTLPQVNAVKYCGTSEPGPQGIVPTDGVLYWKTNSYTTYKGWEICFDLRPPISPPSLPPSLPPPVPPLLPGGVQISGECTLSRGGSCVTSPNYPSNYGGSQTCDISNMPRNPLAVLDWAVELIGDAFGSGLRKLR